MDSFLSSRLVLSLHEILFPVFDLSFFFFDENVAGRRALVSIKPHGWFSRVAARYFIIVSPFAIQANSQERNLTAASRHSYVEFRSLYNDVCFYKINCPEKITFYSLIPLSLSLSLIDFFPSFFLRIIVRNSEIFLNVNCSTGAMSALRDSSPVNVYVRARVSKKPQ